MGVGGDGGLHSLWKEAVLQSVSSSFYLLVVAGAGWGDGRGLLLVSYSTLKQIQSSLKFAQIQNNVF